MAQIRYFATTDDSHTGHVALEYLKGLLRIGPVRVLSLSGGLGDRWQAYASLLGTPLVLRDIVSAVCCLPSQWTWDQRVAMANVRNGQVVSTDYASERIELYTVGMRNVMLAAAAPPVDPQELQDTLTTALRYQAFVVPTVELGARWQRLDCHPRVIPVPVLDHGALRAAFVP